MRSPYSKGKSYFINSFFFNAPEHKKTTTSELQTLFGINHLRWGCCVSPARRLPSSPENVPVFKAVPRKSFPE